MEELQKELKKQAEILGDLNLELNRYMEDNQKLSLQIVKLEERITKKKKLIQQQGKDKSIIHEKLIKAQNKKQRLQIQIGSLNQHQTKKQQINMSEPQIRRPQFLNKPQKKQEIGSYTQKKQKQESEYQSSGKGQYKPPLLLIPADVEGQHKNEQDDKQQENEEEDDQKILQSVRSKLQNLANEDDDEEETV